MQQSTTSKGLILLGFLLALGMTIGSFILGSQAKQIGSGKQTIVVKGVAEQAISADQGQWSILISSKGATFEEALQKLRQERPQLSSFLMGFKIKKEQIAFNAESVTPNIKTTYDAHGNSTQTQDGFNGSQWIQVNTQDLVAIQNAQSKLIEYQAKGHNVTQNSPEFLVGDLNQIKMKLIGEATKNAKMRADVFSKNGDVNIGTMRSASQGTFDILSADANSRDDDSNYGGGTYDKSSINKIARLVVTIEYNIKP